MTHWPVWKAREGQARPVCTGSRPCWRGVRSGTRVRVVSARPGRPRGPSCRPARRCRRRRLPPAAACLGGLWRCLLEELWTNSGILTGCRYEGRCSDWKHRLTSDDNCFGFIRKSELKGDLHFKEYYSSNEYRSLLIRAYENQFTTRRKQTIN